MRPAWRLAINTASERLSRTVFLALAVALSAALVSAVACAVKSLNNSVEQRLATTVGAGDLRVRTAGGSGMGIANFDERTIDAVRTWPEVRAAIPRLYAPLALSFERPIWTKRPVGTDFERSYARFSTSVLGVGMLSDIESELRPLEFIEGTMPGPGEIVIDTAVLERLTKTPTIQQTIPPPANIDLGPASVDTQAQADEISKRFDLALGATLTHVRIFGSDTPLKLVGIVRQPPLGGRPQAYVDLPTLQKITGSIGLVSEIDIILNDGIDADAAATTRKSELSSNLLLVTTEKITSGVQKNMKSNELGFVLLSVMSFLAAGFIITTAMTTNVTERQRELAVLRCIGATRAQLAEAQLGTGLIIGGIGSIIGVPLGVLLAVIVFYVFRDRLQADLTLPPAFLALALFGSLFAGLIGTAIPAWKASRVSPLSALAARAKIASRRGILITLALAVVCIALPLAIVSLVHDSQLKFWLYALVGLPSMFLGYFLLGVPAIVALSALLGPVVSRCFRLPRRMVERNIRATPYRFGFTAGAMMLGLAVMVGIWTQGSSILRDWLDKLEFPDGFVLGTALSPESATRLNQLEGIVTGSSAITMHPIETDAFGVRALQRYTSTFIAFEPDDFFPLAKLTWIQGDQQSAWKKLNQGGAVIVAREFQVANGLGVGDRFKFRHEGEAFDFEIVGVVTSPGLDVVSKFFQIGEEYLDQSIHAVFGTRRDLRDKLLKGQEPPIQLLQFGLDKRIDTEEEERDAVAQVRQAMLPFGVLEVGSGRRIKSEIVKFVSGALVVSSAVAVLSMLVAGFGVANLIIAGIHARQFEFGVLRAVGAHRGVILRLVLAEAVIIALAASIIGTLMGTQAVFAGQKLDAALLGLSLSVRPPLGPIALGWAFVFTMTLGAALPAVLALAKRSPRTLLSALRG
jgi:putative ABC transport system permease protein